MSPADNKLAPNAGKMLVEARVDNQPAEVVIYELGEKEEITLYWLHD